MTNNEKLNGYNIHFTIFKLKEFMYKSRQASSSEKLDLLISEVKQFVTNDKLLTLSTCSDNGQKRLVIHAVLLSDN